MRSRILLVDDDPLVLRAIARILSADFDVSLAETGAEALQRLNTDGTYSAVVADLRMPSMDGATFLTRAKEVAPSTTRIVLTGCECSDLVQQATAAGETFMVLSKPCSSADLRSALKRATQQSAQALALKPPSVQAATDAGEPSHADLDSYCGALGPCT